MYEIFVYYLPVIMFATLAVMLFTGYPVAWILGGLTLIFGGIGIAVGEFEPIEFYNIVPRIFGGIAENLVLVALPTFVFMGTMMERSGIANDLLRCLQVLLQRVPGGLALAVTVMGTILAAMTGIIGASVTMMSVLALPSMLRQGYSHALATGTIAASGTLGILIPPSILLVIMGDLLAVSVGNMFMAAILPGLTLALLYFIYILTLSASFPRLAPPLPDVAMPGSRMEYAEMITRSFLPPVVLILFVKGSILYGWATPSEAGAVGAFGASALAAVNRRLTWPMLKQVCQSSALTIGMIFAVFIGATGFAYVYRVLGGDDIVFDLVQQTEFGPWGLLILLMALVFFLGFFLDWVEITLIVLPVFTPIVVALDFGDHVDQADVVYWFAILVAVNLQTSFLTPPFGFALFYMKGVAPKEVQISSIYVGIIPFVLLQLMGLIAVTVWPGIALWLPRTLLI